MITRLLDRVPAEWAMRWARRTNAAHVVFMVAYLIAWWVLGFRTWALHNLTQAEAMLLSMGWVPTMLVWLFFQGLSTHALLRRAQAAHDRFAELHALALAAAKVQAAESEPTPGPAVH